MSNNIPWENIAENFAEVLLTKLAKADSSVILVKRWLRTKEVANYLGISPSQVHKLKYEGILSCRKLGGTNYYDRREIDQLLENKEVGR